VFVIGQSLECWRGSLAAAVARHDPVPLLDRARRQLNAGADALDVNFGAQPRAGLAADLHWTAEVLRTAYSQIPLFLDCGDIDALTLVVAVAPGPLVFNAVPLDGPPDDIARRALEVAAAHGAGVVFSPRVADREDSPSAILDAAEEARALADHAGLNGPLYLDCLAYPAATHAARCRRSLAWLHTLYEEHDAKFVPLVAAGNVGHGAGHLKRAAELVYVVLAMASGTEALMLRAEDSLVMSLIAVMEGQSSPTTDLDRWAVEITSLPSDELLTLPPPTAELREAWELLTR
jgi:hypothetical protein